MSVGQALVQGVASPARVMVATVKTFFAIFSDSEKVELVDEVGVVKATAAETKRGAAAGLTFLGALSAYFWPVFCILSVFALPSRKKKAAPG